MTTPSAPTIPLPPHRHPPPPVAVMSNANKVIQQERLQRRQQLQQPSLSSSFSYSSPMMSMINVATAHPSLFELLVFVNANYIVPNRRYNVLCTESPKPSLLSLCGLGRTEWGYLLRHMYELNGIMKRYNINRLYVTTQDMLTMYGVLEMIRQSPRHVSQCQSMVAYYEKALDRQVFSAQINMNDSDTTILEATPVLSNTTKPPTTSLKRKSEDETATTTTSTTTTTTSATTTAPYPAVDAVVSSKKPKMTTTTTTTTTAEGGDEEEEEVVVVPPNIVDAVVSAAIPADVELLKKVSLAGRVIQEVVLPVLDRIFS